MTLLEGLLWLTLNVYHEARSESMISQMAIVHVTLNRAFAQGRPVKDIITQAHQFSWTTTKQSYVPDDPKAFMQCLQSVYAALQTDDMTKGATHFHSDRINPGWTSEYTYITHFGSHQFYK